MTSMVLGDTTLESLTPTVNAPLKVWKDMHIYYGQLKLTWQNKSLTKKIYKSRQERKV